MHIKRMRVRSVLLALACAGMLVASMATAQASIDSGVDGGQPVQGPDPDGSYVDCEDGETGIITPGSCPGVAPGPEVQGNGQPASGSSTSAPLPTDPNAPALVGAVRTKMRLTLDIDALGRDRFTLDAPRSVFMSTPRGGVLYKAALTGEGGLREYRIPQDWGVELSFTRNNVSNCSDLTLVNGNVIVWSGRDYVPSLGVFAVVTGTQIFTRTRPPQPTTFLNPLKPFIIEFTCNVR